MSGRVRILYAYVDGSQSAPIEYGAPLIRLTCERVAARELGHYQGVDKWLYQALDRHPVTGQQVAIMGSADQGYGPWYECICLEYGGKPTTVDYNPIRFGDPRLRFLKAPPGADQWGAFDAAFSISSFEHDGLGRYGDPVDPDGDLKAMALMKKLIRKGGIMFLAVPVGKDAVVYNIHRIYGRARLPRLLAGWSVVECFGFQDEVLDRDTGYGWNPTRFVKTPEGMAEELLHPGYAEYSPVWVLRND